MPSGSKITYKIDQADTIVFISDSWNRFAVDNDGADVTDVNVLNRSLWNFISDETTCQLYKEIIKQARAGKILELNFLCDSPDKVRVMRMLVSSEPSGAVQFETEDLQIKERSPQKVLDKNALRNDDLIRICGWCKAIDTGVDDWKELDEAISIMGLFEQDKLPHLTHGMCDDCYLTITGKLAA